MEWNGAHSEQKEVYGHDFVHMEVVNQAESIL